MAVPAEAPLDPLAPHGLVAGDGVLDVAGQQVAVVGQAVGERRPVVEDVLVVAPGPTFDRVLEGALSRPERQNLALQVGEAG